MIAGFDWHNFDHLNLALNVFDVLAFLLIAALILTIMHRQQRDLSDSKKLLKGLEAYAIQHDEDSRKWRHAIKNLAIALDMQEVVRALDEPLAFETAVHEDQVSFFDGLLDERNAIMQQRAERMRGDAHTTRKEGLHAHRRPGCAE